MNKSNRGNSKQTQSMPSWGRD